MSSYLTRLRKEQLTTGRDRTEDRLFINQLFDGQTLRDGLYLRCTFANISFNPERAVRTAPPASGGAETSG